MRQALQPALGDRHTATRQPPCPLLRHAAIGCFYHGGRSSLLLIIFISLRLRRPNAAMLLILFICLRRYVALPFTPRATDAIALMPLYFTVTPPLLEAPLERRGHAAILPPIRHYAACAIILAR